MLGLSGYCSASNSAKAYDVSNVPGLVRIFKLEPGVPELSE